MTEKMNDWMMELDPQELEKAAGGDAYDVAVELAKYLDWLVEKYNTYGKGPEYLNKMLTPEERAKIHQYWDIILAE